MSYLHNISKEVASIVREVRKRLTKSGTAVKNAKINTFYQNKSKIGQPASLLTKFDFNLPRTKSRRNSKTQEDLKISNTQEKINSSCSLNSDFIITFDF